MARRAALVVAFCLVVGAACVADAASSQSRSQRIPVKLSKESAAAVRGSSGSDHAVRQALEAQHGAGRRQAEAGSSEGQDYVMPEIVKKPDAKEAAPKAEKKEAKAEEAGLSKDEVPRPAISAQDVAVPKEVNAETFGKLRSAKKEAVEANGRVKSILGRVPEARQHAEEATHRANDRIRETVARIDQAQDAYAAAKARHTVQAKHTRRVDEPVVTKPLQELAFAGEAQRRSINRKIEGVEDKDSFSSPLLVDKCNNGRQDPGETGVDCGGSCPPCGIDPQVKEAVERANAEPGAKHGMHEKPPRRETSFLKVGERGPEMAATVKEQSVPVVMSAATAVADEAAETASGSDLPRIPREMVESTRREAELVGEQNDYLNHRMASQVAQKYRLKAWERALHRREQQLEAEEEQLQEAETKYALGGGVPNVPAATAGEQQPVAEQQQVAPEPAAEQQQETVPAAPKTQKTAPAPAATASEEAPAPAPAATASEEAPAATAAAPAEETGATGGSEAAATGLQQEADDSSAGLVDELSEESSEDAASAVLQQAQEVEQSGQQTTVQDMAAQQSTAPEGAAVGQDMAFKHTRSDVSSVTQQEASAKQELAAAERTLERLEDAGVPDTAFLEVGSGSGPEAGAEGSGSRDAKAATAGMSAEELQLRDNLDIVRKYLAKNGQHDEAPSAEELAALSSLSGKQLDALLQSLPAAMRAKYDTLTAALADAQSRSEVLRKRAARVREEMNQRIEEAKKTAADLQKKQVEGEKEEREQLKVRAVELEQKAAKLEEENNREKQEFDSVWDAEDARRQLQAQQEVERQMQEIEVRTEKAVADVQAAASNANATVEASHQKALDKLAAEELDHGEKVQEEELEHELQARHQELLREHLSLRRNVTESMDLERKREEHREAMKELKEADKQMKERKKRFKEVEAREAAAQRAEDATMNEHIKKARAAAQKYVKEVQRQEEADRDRVKTARESVDKFEKEAEALEEKEQALAKKADSLAEQRTKAEAEAAEHERSLQLAKQQETELEARLKAVEEQQRTTTRWEAQAEQAETLLKKLTRVPRGNIRCDDGTYVFDGLNCPGGGEIAKLTGEEREKRKEEAEKTREDAEKARKEAVDAANKDVVERVQAALKEAQQAIKEHEAELKKYKSEVEELQREQEEMVKQGEEAEEKRRETEEKRRKAEMEAVEGDRDDEIQLAKLREARDRLDDEEMQAEREQQQRNATRQERREQRMERFEDAFHAYELARRAEVRRIKEHELELDEAMEDERVAEEKEKLHTDVTQKRLNMTLTESVKHARQQAEQALLRAREAVEASRNASLSRVQRTLTLAMQSIKQQRAIELQHLNRTAAFKEVSELHSEQQEARAEEREREAEEHEKEMDAKHLKEAHESRDRIKAKLGDARKQLKVAEGEMEKDLADAAEEQMEALKMEKEKKGSDAILKELEDAKEKSMEAREDAPVVTKAKATIESLNKELLHISEMATDLRIKAATRKINEIEREKKERETEAQRRVRVAKLRKEATAEKASARVSDVKHLLRKAVNRALDQDAHIASKQQETVDAAVGTLDRNAHSATVRRSKQTRRSAFEEDKKEAVTQTVKDDDMQRQQPTGATGAALEDVEDHRFARADDDAPAYGMETAAPQFAAQQEEEGMQYAANVPPTVGQPSAPALSDSLANAYAGSPMEMGQQQQQQQAGSEKKSQRAEMRKLARVMSAPHESEEAVQDELATSADGSAAPAAVEASANSVEVSGPSTARRLLGLRGAKDFRFRQLNSVPAGEAADAANDSTGTEEGGRAKMEKLLAVATKRMHEAQESYDKAEADVKAARGKMQVQMKKAKDAAQRASQGGSGDAVRHELDVVEEATSRAQKQKPVVADKEHAAEAAKNALSKAKKALKEVRAILYPEEAQGGDADSSEAAAAAEGATGGPPDAEAQSGGVAEVAQAAERQLKAVPGADEGKASAYRQLMEEIRKLRAELGVARREEHKDLVEKRHLADQMAKESLEAVAATGDVPEDLAVAANAASLSQSKTPEEREAAVLKAEESLAAKKEKDSIAEKCPCAVKPVCACKMQKRACGCKPNSPCGCSEDFCPCGKYLPCGCAHKVGNGTAQKEPESADDVAKHVQAALAREGGAEKEKAAADNSTVEATIVIHRYPTKTEVREEEEAKEEKALKDEADAASELAEARREEVALKRKEVQQAAEAEKESRAMRDKLVERVQKLRGTREKEKEVRETESQEKRAEESEQTVKQELTEKVDSLKATESKHKAAKEAAEEKEVEAETPEASVQEVEKAVDATGTGEAPSPDATVASGSGSGAALTVPKDKNESGDYTPVNVQVAPVESRCDPTMYSPGNIPVECPQQAPPSSIPYTVGGGQLPGGSIPNVPIKPSAQVANEPSQGDSNTWNAFNRDGAAEGSAAPMAEGAERPFGTYVPPADEYNARMGRPTSFLQRVASFLQLSAGEGPAEQDPYSMSAPPGEVQEEQVQADALRGKANAMNDAVTDRAEAASVSQVEQDRHMGSGGDPVDQAPSSTDMAKRALDEARNQEEVVARQVGNAATDATARQQGMAKATEGSEVTRLLPELPAEIKDDKLFAETRDWLSKYDPDINPGVALNEGSARAAMAAQQVPTEQDEEPASDGFSSGSGQSLDRLQDEVMLHDEQAKSKELDGEIASLIGKMPANQRPGAAAAPGAQ